VRIAHVNPTYWPEVMRGTERLVHDLATAQAAAGHEVTILTSRRGASKVSEEDGVRVVRRRRLPEPPPLRWYELHLVNVPRVIAGLVRGRFDVAHVHFPSDAWGAALAHRLGGPPFVFTIHGIPTRPYLVARRYRLEMLRRAIEAAAAVTVGSEAAARPLRDYALCEPVIVPPGLRVAQFATDRDREDQPTIVCAASLGDPRKRAALLFDAFERLRRHRPEARLRVFETRDPVLSAGGRPPLPEGAEELRATSDPAELAAIYRSSWVSVLPAVEEAFGLVLTESLAAGTPVVADRSGAGPEILDGAEGVGRLFEPDDPEDLARAMSEALELAAVPETVERCRRRAGDFDWSRLEGEWDRIYATAGGDGRAR
jgi:glycosyltransferase involved in cell wall biosynthesis